MDYEFLTKEQQRQMTENSITNLETQHFTAILEKIANSGNPANANAIRTLDDRIKNLEASIAALKQELAGFDAPTPVGEAPVIDPAPTNTPPVSTTPNNDAPTG